jgi:hypothetical protein
VYHFEPVLVRCDSRPNVRQVAFFALPYCATTCGAKIGSKPAGPRSIEVLTAVLGEFTMPIAPDVQLGEGVTIHHPDLVNLYGL